MSVRPSEDKGGDILLSTPTFTLSGQRGLLGGSALPEAPLVIALPGGGYGWRYFDVEGHSLLRRASALGVPILALDRPGYGASTPLKSATLKGNAERLNEAIGDLWEREAGGARGVVLVGHSIGGAIAVTMAALDPQWPLLGLAISGVGLTPPPEVAGAWNALPDLQMIDLPAAAKHPAMFGPAWTYSPDAPVRSETADAPVPRSELLDIVTWWPEHALDLAARVTAPVHYRQGEFDGLWVSNAAEVRRFGDAFTASSDVDARLFRAAGHCIDFHRLGAAFQLEQLAFALRCAGGENR